MSLFCHHRYVNICHYSAIIYLSIYVTILSPYICQYISSFPVFQVLREQGLGKYCDEDFIRTAKREMQEAMDLTDEEFDAAAQQLLETEQLSLSSWSGEDRAAVTTSVTTTPLTGDRRLSTPTVVTPDSDRTTGPPGDSGGLLPPLSGARTPDMSRATANTSDISNGFTDTHL